MRVPVRAMLGAMAELGLHRLHGLAARLARHRMPPHLVVAEHAETELHHAVHESPTLRARLPGSSGEGGRATGIRGVYRATAKGRALDEAKEMVRELYGELFEDD